MQREIAVIRNAEHLTAWERSYTQGEPPDYVRNLRLYEALHAEAQTLGIFPLKDPLEGLEHLIRLVKVLNGSRAD